MIRRLIERFQTWCEERDAQRRRRAREARVVEMQQRLHALHVIEATPPPIAREHRDFFRRSMRHG